MDASAAPDSFRWRAFFQHCREPLFVLNRRRRIMFANRAWEQLTGQSAANARGLTCTRRAAGDPLSPLARTLCPPAEVLHGQSVRVQRPLPAAAAGPPWWEIEFLPLAGEHRLLGVLGVIRSAAGSPAGPSRQLTEALAALRSQAAARYRLDDWQTAAPAFAPIPAQARLAAASRCPVSLIGERGTGKQWLARAIHHASDRRLLPFIPLDCDHLPPPALRGILHGPLGLDHPYWGGTLYLRDPAALPRELQAELADRLADLPDAAPRIMAGFPADPADDIRSGRLAEQLPAALTVLTIRLPPLRERLAGMPQLVESTLRRVSGAVGRPAAGLTPEAWECVRSYRWPGNLRELHATLRAAAERTAAERIDTADLPLAVRQAKLAAEAPPRPTGELPGLDAVLEQVERRMIELALKRAGGNQSKAAEMLGVWRPRLIRRIKALGIDDKAQE
jgi:DNA-binding NtrC family response regulator